MTQPLIVAKVGLQSKPPPDRKGKPFKSFVEVLRYIVNLEGPAALFKGIGPQLLKGLLVQGVLMMIKEKMELVFLLLLAYVRQVRTAKIQQAANTVRSKTNIVAKANDIKTEAAFVRANNLVPVSLK